LENCSSSLAAHARPRLADDAIKRGLSDARGLGDAHA
jgi:hypothetical protein